MFKVNNKLERRSGVFILNFEHIFTPFSNPAIVNYEQVSVCRGVLICVNIITQR